MKILLKHIILIWGFTINLSVFVAQQIPVYSQFFMNKYTQNPAFAGMDHLYSVTSNHRYQWVGLQDYPRTYTLSINGPTKDLKNGIGAFLYTDNVGPTRRTGFQASYAYHTKINEQINISLSLSAGLIEWKIDGHQLTFTEPGDPSTTGKIMRSIMPDAKFGFLFYGDKWHAGGAAPNLLQNKIKFSDISNPHPGNKLEDHYLAKEIANNRIALIHTIEKTNRPIERNGINDMGGKSWHWEESIYNGISKEFLEYEIKVRQKDSNQYSYTIKGYLVNE